MDGTKSAEGRPEAAPDDEFRAYVATIQRLINCLSDPDRSTRRQSLQSLIRKIFTGDAATPKAPPNLLQQLFAGPLLHPVVNLLKDPVEQCRSLSIQMLKQTISTIPNISPVLPALIPTLLTRIGTIPVQEPSEEVKLELVQLVLTAIPQASPTDIDSFLPDLVSIIQRGLEDSFHEIKKASCSCLTAVSAKAPPLSMTTKLTPKLTPTLIANLAHQHSRVRLSCIQALDSIIRAGLPAGLLETTIIPGIRALASDRAQNVREALFTAVAAWLGYTPPPSTPNQTQKIGSDAPPTTPVQPTVSTYAPSLLPLLLLGITDPQDSVSTLSLKLLEGVGSIYLSQTSHPVSLDLPGSPMDTDTPLPSPTPPATVPYPKPFTTRPPPGARQLVSDNLASILPPVLRDLREWTTSLRSTAARSLQSALVLAEATSTDHLNLLLPALCSAVADEDAEVATYVVSSVHMIGTFVLPERWLPLALDQACGGSKTSVGQRASSLVVLSALLHAAGTAGRTLSSSSLTSLSNALVSEDLLSATDHPSVRSQLLAVITNTMRLTHTTSNPTHTIANGTHSLPPPTPATAATTTSTPNNGIASSLPPNTPTAATATATATSDATLSSVSRQLFFALLQILGHEADPATSTTPPSSTPTPSGTPTAPAPPSTPGTVTFALHQLAASCSLHTPEDLASLHAQDLLPTITGDHATWGAQSPNFLVFAALLHTCSETTLSQLLPSAASVMKSVLENPERDPNLRLSILKLVDALMDTPARGRALGGANALLTLSEILAPPLVWRAGKVAAAVRFSAVTALATMLRQRLVPEDVMAAVLGSGTILPLLYQTMEDDWYADVRHVSCYVVEQVVLLAGGTMSHDVRRAMYIELTKRLDDSNNKVRIAACAALRAFCTTMPKEYCDTNSGYLAQGVVVHMDDSEVAVQEAACSVLEALAAVKPEATAKEMEKVRERFRSKHYCDRVLAACKQARAPA